MEPSTRLVANKTQLVFFSYVARFQITDPSRLENSPMNTG